MSLVQIKSNDQLDIEEKQRQETLFGKQTLPVISSLSGYLDTVWEKAKRAKSPYQLQMEKNIRARKGTYESDKLDAIRKVFGVDYDPPFIKITETKCRAFEDWVKEFVFQDAKPWDLMPTPIPDLPDEIAQHIREKVFQEELQQAMTMAQAANVQGDIIAQFALEQMQEKSPEIEKAAKKKIYETAKERIEEAKTLIDDQFHEGGFYVALKKVQRDISTSLAGIIKGPVNIKEKIEKMEFNPVTGRHELVIKEQVIPKYYRVDPLDVYPIEGSSGLEDGLFERGAITRSALSNLRGLKNYNAENINKVLLEHQEGSLAGRWLGLSVSRPEAEDETSQIADTKVDKLEYWGTIPGKLLTEWGITDLDINNDYECHVIKIGNHVIKATINPDPLGKKPYHKASFIEVNGEFWGQGVPQLLEDIQKICNAVSRAIVNNAAFASGPQVVINEEMLAPGESAVIWPYKSWRITDDQMKSGSKPVDFHQPPLVALQLQKVFEFFLRLADEQSVPSFAHGGSKASGAASTSK